MELTTRERELAHDPVRQLVLKYSIPAVIGMLVNALYNVVDRFWIGQLNDVNAMSGIGLTAPLSNILLAFMMLPGIGATAILSIRLGERRKHDAEVVLGNAFTMCLTVGIGLALACLGFLDPILRTFGASDATLPYARDYMQIILYGNVFNTISFAMNHTIRGGGFPRRAATTQLVGAILNVFLDPLFIFVFRMGVAGAAWATIISQLVSAVYVMAFYWEKKAVIEFHVGNMRPRPAIFGQIMAIGVSSFAMQIATSFVTVLANRALRTQGGDLAIGAMTVISSMQILVMMPVFGINQGLQPILGYNYGARSYERVQQTWRFGALLATAVVSIGFIGMQLFPNPIISAFIRDPELNRIGTAGLRITMLMMPIVGFQVISTVYFTSIGKARVSLMLSLLRQVIVLAPLYLILPQLFGVTGVWMAVPIADLVATTITAFMILREMRLLRGMILMRNEQITATGEMSEP